MGSNRAPGPHLSSHWRRFLWFLLLVGVAAIRPLAQEHAFDVRDSIEMVHFSDPTELAPGPIAKYSPDGKYFVCTTSRGIVSTNQVESTISVFSAVEARRYLASRGASAKPRPAKIASIAVRVAINAIYPYAPVIEDVLWTSDSRALLFLAQTERGTRRLYRASILSHKVELLSLPDQDVQRFNAEAGTIVYTVSRPRPTTISENTLQSDPGAVAATGISLPTLLFKLKSADPGDCELWTYRNQQGLRLQSLSSCWPDTVSLHIDPFSLSPGGRFLAWLNHAPSVPKEWSKFTPKPGYFDQEDAEGGSSSRRVFVPQQVRQYGIFDLRSGKIAALIDAPYAGSWGYFGLRNAAWSPDGLRLAITDVLLPSMHSAEDPKSAPDRPCLLAVFTMATGATECVTSVPPRQDLAAGYGPYRLYETQWDSNGRDLVALFHNTKIVRLLHYTEENGRWRNLDEQTVDTDVIPEPGSKNLPAVSVRQSFDAGPPTLWIHNDDTDGVPLWDPNPQLSRMAFGKVSFYHWTDRAGAHWTGGLVLPVGYIAGRKYPLVIQTHGVWDKMFMTDGCFPSAMAARPLASAGFIVLQMGLVDADQHTGSPTEADEAALGIDAAIDKLMSDGLIDPSRIGITGFSRTSWQVETDLVKYPHRFAAAIIADGIDEGYMQYVLLGDGNENLRRESERINQGAPFGANLNKWLKSSVTFQLDQISTPIRIEAHGPESLLCEWQIYASLRLQHKPVDLLYFLKEQHIPQNPSDRIASQQGAVDWYRFWLKGEEDPDPGKISQYRRWEALRAQRDLEGAAISNPAL